MRLKKNDLVQVISGGQPGKKGRILRIFPKKNLVIVEGVNYVFKHLKKTQKTPQGGRVQKEAPIHISNVMLYCPHAQQPTRTFFKYEEVKKQKKEDVKTEKHIKIRYSQKSKRQV
jgi:large subunit ribosomal protein L24